MARSFHRRERLEALSDLNVTPLIDMAFSLLIIFMIAAPLLEQTIKIDLPTESAHPQEAQEEVASESISIDAKGIHYLGSQPMSYKELDLSLKEIAASGADPIIHLRADKKLPYQKVIDVVDLLKKYKLAKLELDTRAK